MAKTSPRLTSNDWCSRRLRSPVHPQNSSGTSQDKQTEIVCPGGAKELYDAAAFAACRASGITTLLPTCVTASPDTGDQITEKAFGGTEHGSPSDNPEDRMVFTAPPAGSDTPTGP